MFRVRVADDSSRPNETKRPKAAMAAGSGPPMDDYFLTHHANVPLVGLTRMFGMLPACTRFPLILHLEKDGFTFPRRMRHLACHAVLWIYSFLLWLTNSSFTVLLTVYAVAMTQKQETPIPNINWILFDVLTCWQSALLGSVLLFLSGNFGWFMSSLDYMMVSFASESFRRPDMNVATQKESLDDSQQFPESDPEDEDEANKELMEDPSDFADSYIRNMRTWVIFITLTAAGLAITAISCVVGFRMKDFDFNPMSGNVTAHWKRATLPLREMVLWASTLAEREQSPRTSDSLGLFAECLQVAIGCVAPAVFASCAICLTTLITTFNRRLRAAADCYLDIDKTVTVHYRFKRLLRRMEKSVAGIAFFTILGDIGIILAGTFMGFNQGCKWKKDGVCEAYLVRHILVIVQLLTVSIFGATLNDKMEEVNSVLDAYTSRKIFNTDRLKIMGVMNESRRSGFSAWGFFRLTRPSVLIMLSLVLMYVSVILRRHF